MNPLLFHSGANFPEIKNLRAQRATTEDPEEGERVAQGLSIDFNNKSLGFH